ncbi:sensor histidine kinase [Streptomyces sp. NPDC059166]|uniref:sensor histidine kinase n=1 Tax=Streptomyces sp. NPDC059166 TaxID=3346752 RepID=UPI003693A7B5
MSDGTDTRPRLQANGTDTDTDTAPLTRWVQALAHRLRAFDRRRPLPWDLTVTALWVTVAVLDYTSGGWRTVARNTAAPEPLVLLMSLCFSVPLLWRRTRPVTLLLLMAPVSAANVWTGAVVQVAFLQMIPAFTIGLRLPLRTLAGSGALICLPVTLGAAVVPGADSRQLVSYLWGFVSVALLALVVRTRREYTEALVERAHRLERERDQQAQLSAAAERARIAREMHDIIGHNLSVITSLADGGAYAAARNPERAAQALEAIGTTSRQALTDLRRALGVLSDSAPAADRAPQPSLDDLDTLLTGVREAGLPVRLTTDGTPPSVPASSGHQLTVYRVVQESLTNTLKHAGPDATAEIVLTYTPEGLEVHATDTGGRSLPAQHPNPSGGRGINGMRERAGLYHGTLESGPRPEGGWQTRLRLPLEDPAP